MIRTMSRLFASLAFPLTLLGASARIHAATSTFHYFKDIVPRGYRSFFDGVSADGSTVVGSVLSEDWSGSISNPSFDGVIWRVGAEPEILKNAVPGHQSPFPYAASADGAVVVGVTASPAGWQAFRKGDGRESQLLGGLNSANIDSSGIAVSADGSVVAGSSSSTAGWEAFRWTESTGMVGLGDLPGGGFYSSAYGMSADGNVIVGSSTTQVASELRASDEAFRWTESSGMQGLGYLPGATYASNAYAISGDGHTIVGAALNGLGNGGAFRWTEATGMVELDRLTPNGHGAAFAISMDGSVVGGRASLGSDDDHAVVWNSKNQVMRVADLLGSLGIDVGLDGYTLRSVTGISADGTTLVGMAYRGNGTAFGGTGWVAVLPRSIYVPEPGGLGVLGFGLAGWGLVWRRGPRPAVAAL